MAGARIPCGDQPLGPRPGRPRQCTGVPVVPQGLPDGLGGADLASALLPGRKLADRGLDIVQANGCLLLNRTGLEPAVFPMGVAFSDLSYRTDTTLTEPTSARRKRSTPLIRTAMRGHARYVVDIGLCLLSDMLVSFRGWCCRLAFVPEGTERLRKGGSNPPASRS